MAKLISLKIDVSKIDKNRLFKGAKGTYLDLTISVNDEKDQYDNDVAAWQGQTKKKWPLRHKRHTWGMEKFFGVMKKRQKIPTRFIRLHQLAKKMKMMDCLSDGRTDLLTPNQNGTRSV